MESSHDAGEPRRGDQMAVRPRSEDRPPELVRIEEVLGRSGDRWVVQGSGGRIYLAEPDPAAGGDERLWLGRVV